MMKVAIVSWKFQGLRHILVFQQQGYKFSNIQEM